MLRVAAACVIGILMAVPAMAQAPLQIVFFPDWSGALDDAAKAVIDRAAQLAKASPHDPIRVTGYADGTGSSQANIYLCKLRAQRVIDLLAADGVRAGRLKLVSAGPQTQVGVAGRRVEIAIGQ